MEFSRQEDWSGEPFPPPGFLPDPGIEPTAPSLAGGSFMAESPGKPNLRLTCASIRHLHCQATVAL